MGFGPDTSEIFPVVGFLRKALTAGGVAAALLVVIGTPGPVKGLKTDLTNLSFDPKNLSLDSVLAQVKQIAPGSIGKIGKRDLESLRQASTRQLTALQSGNLVKYFSKDLSIEQVVHSVLLGSPEQVEALLSKSGIDTSAIETACPEMANALDSAAQLINSVRGQKPGEGVPGVVNSSAIRAVATGCVARYIRSGAVGNLAAR